jgi:hypothetical protein
MTGFEGMVDGKILVSHWLLLLPDTSQEPPPVLHNAKRL